MDALCANLLLTPPNLPRPLPLLPTPYLLDQMLRLLRDSSCREEKLLFESGDCLKVLLSSHTITIHSLTFTYIRFKRLIPEAIIGEQRLASDRADMVYPFIAREKNHAAVRQTNAYVPRH